MATTASVCAVVTLYAWALWAWDWHYVQSLWCAQLAAAIVSWLSTRSISDRGTILLLANLCPCEMQHLERTVFLSETELMDWHYRRSAGLETEQEFNSVLTEEIRSMRAARRAGERENTLGSRKWLIAQRPYYWRSVKQRAMDDDRFNDLNNIWKTTTDENLGDVIQIATELAGNVTSLLPTNNYTLLRPFPFQRTLYKAKKKPPERLRIPMRPWFPKRQVQWSDLLPNSRRVSRNKPSVKFQTPNEELPESAATSAPSQRSRIGTPRSLLRVGQLRQGPRKNISAARPLLKEFPLMLKKTWQKKQQQQLSTPAAVENALPRVQRWERCGITPPEFLHDRDKNIYLGPVRVPQQKSPLSMFSERIDMFQWMDESRNEAFAQTLIHPADLLRIRRQRQHLFDSGLLDLGHISDDALMDVVTQLNTIDFLVLFHHYPELRRFATQVFFAGLGKSCDYVLVVCLLETVTFLCSITPLLVSSFAPRQYQIAFIDFFRSGFLFLVSKKTPLLAVFLSFCHAYVYQRLLVEVVRPAAMHMLLSCQAHKVGHMFTWKAVQPYLAVNTVEMMRSIWNIR